jgi:hypothetical protein
MVKVEEGLQGMSAGSQNRSSLTKTPTFTSQAYKQMACTSDQHCPGNLFCLPAGGSGSSSSFEFGHFDQHVSLASAGQSERNHQKSCGCPPEYLARSVSPKVASSNNNNSSSRARSRNNSPWPETTTLQQPLPSPQVFAYVRAATS